MVTGTIQETSLIDLLREDHRRLKDLYAEFRNGDVETRKRASHETLDLLYTHDKIEKKLLYSTAMEHAGGSQELVLRCKEAHHVLNVLIMELKMMPYGPRYFSKFSILMDTVMSHIDEEEHELFPLLERSGVELGHLGRRMVELRDRLSVPVISRSGSSIGALIGIAALVGVGWLAVNALSED